MIWWTKSWNPVIGCTKCSPACENCYAEALHTQRHKALLAGRQVAACYSKPFGQVQFLPVRLVEPTHWIKPQRIFVGNMGDLFHEDVEEAWLDAIFTFIALCCRHTFMLLTKRPERAQEYLSRPDFLMRLVEYGQQRWGHEGGVMVLGQIQGLQVLPNVWLGTTIWDQPSLERNMPILLSTPAARRFVSVEPMLGPVDFSVLRHGSDHDLPVFGTEWGPDWVICGGETGPGARPMHPDWPRSLRDQCQAAGVPFFFKQWGEWAPHLPELSYNNPATGGKAWGCIDHAGVWMPETTPFNGDRGDYEWPMVRVGTRRAGRVLDGRTWEEVPA